MRLFEELKRRNVIRMAVLYIVASWVILQIADVLFDPLDLPEWTFRFVLGMLLLGFPFALIFSWIFELTPEGVKRERDINRDRSIVHNTGRKMNTVIVILLLVAIGGLAIDRLLPETVPVGPVAPQQAPEAQVAEQATRDTPATISPVNADNDSIAVLPFVNMSGDPDNEYFSDGLTEEILNTLVRVGGLKVTGRTSSFAFKGQNRDMREIGRQLNVANVLEGSVRKAGNRVRVTAQLVKTADGYHLWSDSFDRQLDDIFAIQEEIAVQVSNALHSALIGNGTGGGSSVTIARRDPAAYEAYLRGNYILQRFPDNEAELERAKEYFRKALTVDPDYVDAHYGLFAISDRANRNGWGSFTDSLAEMQRRVDALEQIAPGSARALSAAARKAVVDYEYQKARNHLEEALRKYPGDAMVAGLYASTLTNLNLYDEALRAIERASELDPLSLEVMRWKSFIHHRLGDCEGAEEVMNRALEIEPEVGRFRYYLAMCLFESTRDIDRAIELLEAEPLLFLNQTGLAIVEHARGKVSRARQIAEAMQAQFGDSASYQYGQIHAQWGEKEAALDWLEKAVAIRDPGILQAEHDRLLNPLRDDPRFLRILKEINLEDSARP